MGGRKDSSRGVVAVEGLQAMNRRDVGAVLPASRLLDLSWGQRVRSMTRFMNRTDFYRVNEYTILNTREGINQAKRTLTGPAVYMLCLYKINCFLPIMHKMHARRWDEAQSQTRPSLTQGR